MLALLGAATTGYALIWLIVRPRWLPATDWATLELRVRDVGTRRTPLVGPYSRFEWYHPGPAIFYVLAVPYRLLGSRSNGLLLGALAVNAGAVTTVWWALRSTARAAAPFAFAIVLLFLRALGPSFLIDPWNPHVAVLPFVACVLAAWAAACGRRRFWIATIAFGTFAMQSHIGFVLPVGATVVVAAVMALLRRDGGTVMLRFASSRGVLVATMAGLVGIWVPPLLEQVVGGEGNVSRIVRSARDGDEPAAGVTAATRVLAHEVGSSPSWLTGDRLRSRFTGAMEVSNWAIPTLLFALLVAGCFAVRRGDREGGRLAMLTLVSAAAAALSLASVRGPVYDYLALPILASGMLVGVAAGVAAIGTGAERWPAARRVSRVLVWAAGAASALLLAACLRADAPGARYTPAISALADAAVPWLGAGVAEEGLVLVSSDGDVRAAWVARGVFLQLERRGFRVRAEPRTARELGVQRVADGRDTAVQLYVVSGDEAIARYAAMAGARRLGAVGVRANPDDLQRLVTELERQGIDADDAQIQALLRSFSRDTGAMTLFGVAPRRNG
jgi:hypothetical protein